MLAFAFSSFLIALLLIYVGAGPHVLASIMALDDSLDAHESGLAVVAARNPFRDSGPPANMAKLILLRHKVRKYDCTCPFNLITHWTDTNNRQKEKEYVPYASGFTTLYHRSTSTGESSLVTVRQVCWEAILLTNVTKDPVFIFVPTFLYPVIVRRKFRYLICLGLLFDNSIYDRTLVFKYISIACPHHLYIIYS
ncbi:hypothetical protein F5879DRAFT_684661 [Lentinula edodes]|nr:hypothetical protein F5879DRAFT_684661 [Lentinula edodes]